MSHCQRVIGKGHPQARQRGSAACWSWWPWLFQICVAYLVFRSHLQTYPFFLSDCQMWFTAHMSHICRLSSLTGSVNDVNVSRGECGETSVGFLPHLEVPAIRIICRCCFCSRDLLQSVKNWCQHRSKAKCLFYTECRSSHNLLINQAAQKQILCVWAGAHVCVCTCAAKPHPGGGYSAISLKGPLIREDAIINVSCGFCLKEEEACNASDTKGCSGVCEQTQGECWLHNYSHHRSWPPAASPIYNVSMCATVNQICRFLSNVQCIQLDTAKICGVWIQAE